MLTLETITELMEDFEKNDQYSRREDVLALLKELKIMYSMAESLTKQLLDVKETLNKDK